MAARKKIRGRGQGRSLRLSSDCGGTEVGSWRETVAECEECSLSAIYTFAWGHVNGATVLLSVCEVWHAKLSPS